jgi:hypothetical protein
MAEFCDTTRSPCDSLIKELGKGVAVDKKTGRFFVRAWTKDNTFQHQRWIEVQYCPFCGCRLEILEL